MCRSAIALLAVAALLSVAACTDEGVTAPQPERQEFTFLPGGPLASANTNCVWSPSGDISIAVGVTQTFTPSVLADCVNSYVVVTPSAPGVLGHLDGSSGCSILQKSVPPFKIKKCLSGNGTIRTYTNSSKTTLIQTINVDIL